MTILTIPNGYPSIYLNNTKDIDEHLKTIPNDNVRYLGIDYPSKKYMKDWFCNISSNALPAKSRHNGTLQDIGSINQYYNDVKVDHRLYLYSDRRIGLASGTTTTKVLPTAPPYTLPSGVSYSTPSDQTHVYFQNNIIGERGEFFYSGSSYNTNLCFYYDMENPSGFKYYNVGGFGTSSFYRASLNFLGRNLNYADWENGVDYWYYYVGGTSYFTPFVLVLTFNEGYPKIIKYASAGSGQDSGYSCRGISIYRVSDLIDGVYKLFYASYSSSYSYGYSERTLTINPTTFTVSSRTGVTPDFIGDGNIIHEYSKQTLFDFIADPTLYYTDVDFSSKCLSQATFVACEGVNDVANHNHYIMTINAKTKTVWVKKFPRTFSVNNWGCSRNWKDTTISTPPPISGLSFNLIRDHGNVAMNDWYKHKPLDWWADFLEAPEQYRSGGEQFPIRI